MAALQIVLALVVVLVLERARLRLYGCRYP
jgi:hypothetical protein